MFFPVVERARSQQTDSLSLTRLHEARSYYQLGQQYRTGTDVPMDYAKAVEQFEKAAVFLSNPEISIIF